MTQHPREQDNNVDRGMHTNSSSSGRSTGKVPPIVWAGLALVGFYIVGHTIVEDRFFARRTVRGTAIVEEVTGSGRNRAATVIHEVNGKPVKARISYDSFWNTDEVDVEIPILYLPEDPTIARLANWPARLFPTVFMGCLAALLFGILYLLSLRATKRGEETRNEQKRED